MLEHEQLIAALQNIAQEDYPIHSRVHPLKIGNGCCYVKREDELGCLLSGSKARKYRTLVAALKKRGCKKAGLIGSQFSNQILGLSSLLIENDIEPTLFLLESTAPPSTGNALFIQLFASPHNFKYIKRQDWHQAGDIAASWQSANSSCNAAIVPEGGSVDDSVAGLTTLALDILQNEKQLGFSFKNILIDAGSGLSAATLIAAFGHLKKETHIHVMLAAGTPDNFTELLTKVKQALETLAGSSIARMPPYTCHTPTTAKSFGATNSGLFQAIAHAAQTEGILLDPVYSSKLYLLLKELLQAGSLVGPTLFIHSGGVLSLAGFQDKINATIDRTPIVAQK